MKKHLITASLYTLLTTILLGVVYPAAVTVIAQFAFHDKANGQLIHQGDTLVGSRIIGQPFTGPGYFHSRPSAAGTGYDASASSGSNLAPTNRALADRIQAAVSQEGSSVPVDLVTTSGSGLDPDITPAAAFHQVQRIARERKLTEAQVRILITDHITQRQLGLLGEPAVNVLQINLALADLHP